MNLALVERLMACLVAVILTTSAHAIPLLRVSNGVFTLTLADGSASDADSRTGALAFGGQFGAIHIGRVTGTSAPILGSPTRQVMQLDLQDLTSGDLGGTLTFEYSITDLGPATDLFPQLQMQVATDGAVEYAVYADPGNTVFGRTMLLGSFNYPTGTFSESAQSLAGITDSSYSLTQVITVHHGAGTHTTSVGASVSGNTNVPTPGMPYLLGAGLLALGWARARRQDDAARNTLRPA